jgi:diguanylate cyclase (GGDEF)-like protein/PAS domain S-box-containing protein
LSSPWTDMSPDSAAPPGPDNSESRVKIHDIIESVVSCTTDIFFSMKPGGALEYVSPQWQAQLGHAPESVLGHYFTDFVANADECREAYRQAVHASRSVGNLVVRFVTTNGQDRCYLAQASPDFDAAGKLRRLVGVAKEIHDLITIQDQLKESEYRYRSLLQSLADPAVIYDLEGQCLYLNPAFTRVFGWTLDELQGRQIPFVPEEEARSSQDRISGILERGDIVSQFATKRFTKSGQVRDIVISAALFYDSQDRPAGMSSILRDVTEQKHLETELADRLLELMEVKSQLENQAEELNRLNAEMMLANQRLTELSLTDHLTNLANHRSFQDRLDQEIKRVRRYKTSLSLVMIDLDDFKQYNDTFGHQAGNQALKELSLVLTRTVRETDFVARYGGEEFCLLLPQTNILAAQTVAEKVRSAIEKHFRDGQTTSSRALTISLGLAAFNSDMTKVQLIELADRALYRSKAQGKNRSSVALESLASPGVW